MSVREKIFWIEGVKEGQKLERERIIKLIEDNVGKMTAEVIIALIKEEQK